MFRSAFVLGVSALLLGVSACSSPSDTIGANTASTATVTVTATVTQTAEAAAPSTVTHTATVTAAPTATEATTEASDGAGSNGVVTDGVLEYTLLEVQFPESIESFGTRERPAGQFVLVTLNVSNTSNDAVDFPGWEQQLIDDQGRTHDTSNAITYLDDAFSFDTINPGLSKDGTLLFDIPADAEATALLLNSELFGGNPVELSLRD